MPNYNANELDEIYRKAIDIDARIYAEMRSNTMLVSGDHYAKEYSIYWDRIRNSEGLDKQQKLRLTKNHIRKITQDYTTVLLSHAPGTTVMPNNLTELQDQKAAELNKSVLTYHKKTLNLRAKTRDKAEVFVNMGEVFSKTFYDPDEGDFKGYEPLVDENGIIQMDMDGQVIFDETKPIMSGKFIIESMLPLNVFRACEAKDWEESPFIGYRKMVKNDVLKLIIPQEDWGKALSGGEKDNSIFEYEHDNLQKIKEETLVREYYFRPSKAYPKGYFYITSKTYIIAEGELPFGIFPIAYAIFDKIETSCRGRSPIKQMRPYQVEINRAASAIATAQITLGDDKLVLSHGSKISNGGSLPGLRGISVAGGVSDLTVIPGRTGDQYVAYMVGQIEEMYAVMGVADALMSDKEGKLDPYALLFHSIRNRRKFSKYTEAFADFCKKETEILLSLSKYYLEPDALIPMIGKSEAVNIAEFKNTDPLCYSITVEEGDTDAETMLGRQLAMNHTLQYVGTALSKDEIGKIVRSMPFLNEDEAFEDLTLDYDCARNEILAIERGELPDINPNDNHAYTLRKFGNRMKKSDFKFLDPKIQENFKLALGEHERLDIEQKKAIQRMQSGWIPTDGYLVIADFYVTKPNGKTERVRLPYNSLKWLIDQLKAQGTALEDLERINNQGIKAEMASQMGDGRSSANIPPSNEQQGSQTLINQEVY